MERQIHMRTEDVEEVTVKNDKNNFFLIHSSTMPQLEAMEVFIMSRKTRSLRRDVMTKGLITELNFPQSSNSTSVFGKGHDVETLTIRFTKGTS